MKGVDLEINSSEAAGIVREDKIVSTGKHSWNIIIY